MPISILRKALETKLQSFATSNGDIPIAWEDVEFNPVGKPVFIRSEVFKSETLNVTLGDQHYRAVGYLQLSVGVPSGSGPKVAEDLCDKLIVEFARGKEVLRDGLYVTFPKTPYAISAFTTSVTRYYPIIIRYSLDVFNQ